MKPLRSPLAFALLAAGLHAQAAAPATSVEDAIKHHGLHDSRVMEYLDGLTNGVGHRLTGSDNFTRACEWAREEFAKMGLEARLEEWGEWNVVWNRGQWDGRVLQPEPMELQVATPAWTAGTKGRQSGPLVKGPTTAAELEAMRGKLDGVWIFEAPMPAIPRDLPVEERGARRNEQRELRRQFDAMVKEAKVLGTVSSSEGDRKYPDRIRVFGDSRVPRGSWESIPKIPEIVVRRDQAARLLEMLDAGKSVVVEFDIRNQFRRGPIKLYNVIADLRGTEKPDEIVGVCGHLDSWHQATGTTDNGTGSATCMEAARILAAAGARPARTIRFMLWGGEEQGLLGSNRYVTMHRQEMAKFSCVFNHDTGTNWAQSLPVTEAMLGPMTAAFAPIMTLTPPEQDFDGPVFHFQKVEAIRGGGGSDHASFLRAGVPAWSWNLRGRADYSYSWHSQWDTYDVAIPEYQQHTATVIALAALGVASLPELLPRDGVGGGGAGGGDAGMFLGAMFGAEVEGTTFKAVTEGGLAAKIGIRSGDVLVGLNGEKLERAFELMRLLRDEDVTEIRLTLKRQDAEVSVAVNREDLLAAMRQRREGRDRDEAAAESPRRRR